MKHNIKENSYTFIKQTITIITLSLVSCAVSLQFLPTQAYAETDKTQAEPIPTQTKDSPQPKDSSQISELPQLKEAPQSCKISREYITVLEFLRHHSELGVPEQQAETLANSVSMGCTGAAQRFINITLTLAKAGLTGTQAAQAGLKFTGRSDEETTSFTTVFKIAFSEDGLDLDISSALKLAYSLTTELKINSPKTGEDFKKLARFCVEERTLNLPKPECANFAAKITQHGHNFKDGIAGPFIKLFSFLSTESGPRLTTAQSIELASSIVKNGPTALENFEVAYKYGISRNGLSFTNGKALSFAKQLSLKSEMLPGSESERKPSSVHRSKVKKLK